MIEYNCYWKGQPLESLTKEELIEAVKILDKQWRETVSNYMKTAQIMASFPR